MEITNISKRLMDFINNHVEYFDDGDAENGPHLATEYNGPDWAMRTVSIMEDSEDYTFCCMMEWEMYEVEA